MEPCQGIYRALPDSITDSVPSISLACGFHLSDIHDAGPAVVAYGHDADAARVAADNLVEEFDAAHEDPDRAWKFRLIRRTGTGLGLSQKAFARRFRVPLGSSECQPLPENASTWVNQEL